MALISLKKLRISMLIISKFKDYYDYLQGKWGVDEKLVLDRTEFTKVDSGMLSDGGVYSLFVCDWQYDFYYKDGKFIYGEEIYEYFPEKKGGKKSWFSSWMHSDKRGEGVSLPRRPGGDYWDNTWMYTERVASILKVNSVLGCPILLCHYSGKMTLNEGHRNQSSFCPFPILKDISFAKVVEAEDLWLMLSEWLSKQRDKPITNKQTDKEKIQSHGFDLVKSFRHRK